MDIKAKIHYHDIGDYHTREQKLAKIRAFRSVCNMELSVLAPNEHGDWLNQRNAARLQSWPAIGCDGGKHRGQKTA